MPIYVDSRKEARKKVPTNNFLAELIPIDTFQEDLETRHQDKKLKKEKGKAGRKQEGEEEKRRGRYMIEYSLGGFIRYYSSANIRNKIKHPFYFSYHFHPLLTLYYNREVAPSPLALLHLLEKPLKHDAKKLLLVALTPGKEETAEDTTEELKKKFATLFENWKYFFIEVVIKGSLYFNFMQQERLPAEQKEGHDEAKWAEINPEEILAAYSHYYQEVENRENEERKNSADSDSLPPAENSGENSRRYEHFELHQTICIQSAFKNSAPAKKVKLEE